MAGPSRRSMSPLEDTVMRVIWAKGPCAAETVRQTLQGKQPMKDSTVRTVLRRLEEKGYLTHDVSGRTYIYRERVPALRGHPGGAPDRRTILRRVGRTALVRDGQRPDRDSRTARGARTQDR